MSRTRRVPQRGTNTTPLAPHHKLSKDEQWSALLLALTYLGQLTLDQMSRLLLIPARTLQRRLTQDDDSLTKRGFVERLDQADFDSATARTGRTRSYWQVTPAGLEALKHHEQFPANVLGQDAQYPARLNTIRKGTTQHDRWVAEAVICLIEHARERLGGLSGIFIRFELKMNPFRSAPIADAVVVIHAETNKRTMCHPLPFTRDMPTAGEYYGTFVFEIDMGTEPRSTIQGKAVSYRLMLTDPRWQQQWVGRFGTRLLLLWIVPDERRRDDIRDIWGEQLPDICFFLTTFAEVQHNHWQSYSNGKIDEVLLFPRLKKSLPEPKKPQSISPPAPDPAPASPEQKEAPPAPSPPAQAPPARSTRREVVVSPEQISRTEKPRQAQRATSVYSTDEDTQPPWYKEYERHRHTVHIEVVARGTEHPLKGVEVMVGTAERVLGTACTSEQGQASVRLSKPFDTPHDAVAHLWWSVPTAQRRESLAGYKPGETVQVKMDVPPRREAPLTLVDRVTWGAQSGGVSVWMMLTRGWYDNYGALVAAVAHARAARTPWYRTARWCGVAAALIPLLLVGSLGGVLAVVKALLLLGELAIVVVWSVGVSVLRLALEALVMAWEWWLEWRFERRENTAWKLYCEAGSATSRAEFDQARLAYRPRWPPRERSWMHRTMATVSLLLLALGGLWLLLNLRGADATIAVARRVTQHQPAPTLTVPTPSPAPSPTPALCGYGRVISYRLNVRDAPYGNVVAVLHKGDQVALRCAPTVEQGGVWWVRIEPPPGMEVALWVARNYLEVWKE